MDNFTATDISVLQRILSQANNFQDLFSTAPTPSCQQTAYCPYPVLDSQNSALDSNYYFSPPSSGSNLLQPRPHAQRPLFTVNQLPLNHTDTQTTRNQDTREIMLKFDKSELAVLNSIDKQTVLKPKSGSFASKLLKVRFNRHL